jgi:hypothetical protein
MYFLQIKSSSCRRSEDRPMMESHPVSLAFSNESTRACISCSIITAYNTLRTYADMKKYVESHAPFPINI